MLPTSSVSIDNHGAARETVHYPASKGSRHIGLVNSDLRYLYSHQREAGYSEELAELALPWHGVTYAEAISCEAGSQARRQLLQQPEPPDAVLAVGVVHAAAFPLPAA